MDLLLKVHIQMGKTNEMQHLEQGKKKQHSDYIPDNILLLYCGAHMLPIHCRVYPAGRDQPSGGILCYLEMFYSCLDKREKKKNKIKSCSLLGLQSRLLQLSWSTTKTLLHCSFGGWILPRTSFTSVLAKRASTLEDNPFLERLILLGYRKRFQAGLKKFSCRMDSRPDCKSLNESKSLI